MHAQLLQLSPTLCWTLSMDYSPPGSSFHGDSPGKNVRVGFHSLVQRIFPTQGSNPGLLHCRQILYHLTTLEIHRVWLKKNKSESHCSKLWVVLWFKSHIVSYSQLIWLCTLLGFYWSLGISRFSLAVFTITLIDMIVNLVS